MRYLATLTFLSLAILLPDMTMTASSTMPKSDYTDTQTGNSDMQAVNRKNLLIILDQPQAKLYHAPIVSNGVVIGKVKEVRSNNKESESTELLVELDYSRDTVKSIDPNRLVALLTTPAIKDKAAHDVKVIELITQENVSKARVANNKPGHKTILGFSTYESYWSAKL